MIDANKLADLIEATSERVKVCVPSRDYYARRGDWEYEEIEVIRAGTLIEMLRNLAKEDVR